MKLIFEALAKFACGLLLVGLLVFLPAGTLAYAYGWLFVGLLFVPMLIAGVVMAFTAPEFLRKRLDAKEKQAAQKGVLAFSGCMFIAGFVLAGLDFRYQWLPLPSWVNIVAAAAFLLASRGRTASRTTSRTQMPKVIYFLTCFLRCLSMGYPP